MLVLFFRLLILLAIILLIYTWVEYLRSSERKMRIARSTNTFYFDDEANNSKKNLQFVYRGCLFEGEKYVGTTENSFEVLNIHVTVRDPIDLHGITRDDLYFLENEILLRYPHARIEWKHPISQLILTPIE
ncbi:sigma-w pathway protein ysdB [Oceanobacillus sp. CAU 1775]